MKSCLLTLCLTFVFSLCSPVFAQPAISTINGMPIGGSSSLAGVAYGNSTYVAVGFGGKVYRSADGENWAPVVSAAIPAVDLTAIVFAENLFVVTGAGGLIVTSPDGQVWTARTSGTTNRLNKVDFLNGQFFTVGVNGTVLTSTNGQSWSAVNIGSTTHWLRNIAYGGGVYVIGAINDLGQWSYAFRSTTGASGSWTFHNVLTNGSSLNTVQYLKDRFYAFNSGAEIVTSTNGITWTHVNSSLPVSYPNGTSGTMASGNGIFNGFYDGQLLYFFGSSNYHNPTAYCAIFTSANGTQFTLQSKTTNIVPQGSAYAGGRYFIVGNEGLASSADGSNWAYPGTSYNAVATNGTNFVGVGNTGASEGQVFSSTDFRSWVNRSPGLVNALYGVAWANNQYVAVGAGGLVLTSPNGTAWTTRSSGDADLLRCVAYGAGRYVAAGNQGKLIYSSDGITWTQAKKDGTTGSNFYGLYYLNGRFIAVGGGTANSSTTRVEYSTDGITWTAASPSIVGHFSGIAYDGTRYLLTGRDNTSGSQKFFSVTTTDITNTAAYSTPVTVPSASTGGIDLGTLGFGMVLHHNGRFVTIANQRAAPFDAYVLESTDGSAWTAYSAGTVARLRGMVSTGSELRIVGNQDTKVIASFGSTLPLKLLGFSVQQQGGAALLRWQTAQEEKTDRFEVERSSNGRHFTSLLQVKAAGNGSHSYQAEDHGVKGHGTLYYRLKMLDTDGKFSYSPVRSLQVAGGTAVQVYPNPAQTDIQLLVPGHPATAQVQVYNTAGVLVMERQVARGEALPVGGLKAGSYYLQISADGRSYQSRLTKQ